MKIILLLYNYITNNYPIHDSHYVLDDFFEIYRDRHSPLAMNKLRLLQLANAHYITLIVTRAKKAVQS